MVIHYKAPTRRTFRDKPGASRSLILGWERFAQMLRRAPSARIVHVYAAQRSLDLSSRMR